MRLANDEIDVSHPLTYAVAFKRFRMAISALLGPAATRRFGMHSFRGGGTCAALARGVPAHHIRQQAVWAPGSKMVYHYGRMSTAQRLRHF